MTDGKQQKPYRERQASHLSKIHTLRKAIAIAAERDAIGLPVARAIVRRAQEEHCDVIDVLIEWFSHSDCDQNRSL